MSRSLVQACLGFSIGINAVTACAQQSASLFDIYKNGVLQDAAGFIVEVDSLTKQQKVVTNPKPETGPLLKFQKSLDENIAKNLHTGGKLEQFYVANAAPVTANPTKVRVSGAFPACGEADVQVAEDVKNYIKAIEAMGGAVDLAGAGGVASVVTGVISAIVGLRNRYQTTATCSSSCTLVPAYLKDSDINVQTLVGYGTSYPGVRRDHDPANWSEWSFVDKAIISSEIIAVPIRTGDYLRTKTDAASCQMKMVCSRIRNWSNDRPVSLSMAVFWDATSESQKSCTDFTLISKSYQDGFAKRAMDVELLTKYLRQYSDESMQRGR